MELIDTHCHIHSHDYGLKPAVVIENALEIGVTELICVGTSGEDSQRAVDFVQDKPNCWASIGLHPHDAKHSDAELKTIENLASMAKVVAIGECGLDYYYRHSTKEQQIASLRQQFELAISHKLPMIWHVREAFADFWPIYDSYGPVKGVIHSFTASQRELDQIMKRDLLVGINGIVTFSKNQAQLAAAKTIPLDNLVLETDAPFLTPVPQRGKVNEPRYVGLIADFLANLRQEQPALLTQATTNNARTLFKLGGV